MKWSGRITIITSGVITIRPHHHKETPETTTQSEGEAVQMSFRSERQICNLPPSPKKKPRKSIRVNCPDKTEQTLSKTLQR